MPFFNVRFQGSMPAGDIFIFGFWYNAPVGVQGMADAAEDWITDLWADELATLYTDNTSVDNVVVGEYTSITGSQQARAENGVTLAGSVVSSTTPPLPGDVSLVVSLRTNLANRSGRGRFYLPAPASSFVTANGRFQTAKRDAIAADVATRFGLLNAQVGGSLIVASRTLGVGTNVQRISIGDLFDTQRRRESSLVEARETVDI